MQSKHLMLVAVILSLHTAPGIAAENGIPMRIEAAPEAKRIGIVGYELVTLGNSAAEITMLGSNGGYFGKLLIENADDLRTTLMLRDSEPVNLSIRRDPEGYLRVREDGIERVSALEGASGEIADSEISSRMEQSLRVIVTVLGDNKLLDNLVISGGGACCGFWCTLDYCARCIDGGSDLWCILCYVCI